MKQTLLFLFATLFYLAAHGQRRDSFSVYFPFNQPGLTPEAQTFIDSLSFNDIIHESQSITITGYADYVGANTYNDALSKARANTVAEYLVNNGVKRKNIIVCIGKGKIPFNGATTTEGHAPDRRVDVVLTSIRHATIIPQTPLKQKEGTRTKDLAHAHTGEIATVDKIFFYAGRHTVKEESQPALQQLLRLLQERKNIRIRIEGHVCCINSPDAMDDDSNDLHLSRNRAKAIYNYLVENGIPAARLEYEGFGRSRPMVPIELTEDDANQNRRVEIRILSE